MGDQFKAFFKLLGANGEKTKVVLMHHKLVDV